MALDAIKNFALANVSTGYDNVATSIILAAGHGQLFPAPSTDGDFNAVWWNSTDYVDPSTQHRAYLLGSETEDAEIIRVTARSTDTFSTIVRAQEGTVATNHNKANKVYAVALVLSSKMVNDIESSINAKVVANGAVTGSVKTKITYDTKGLITNGSDATCDDIADGTNTLAGLYGQFNNKVDLMLNQHPTVQNYFKNITNGSFLFI